MGVLEAVDEQHRVLSELVWPRWLVWTAPLTALGLAVLATAVEAGTDRGPGPGLVPGAVALVVASVVPWAACLLGLNPVRVGAWFVAGVLIPLLLLNVAGERLDLVDLDGDQWELTLMLLLLLVAQSAVHGSWRTIALAVVGSLLVLAGRATGNGPGYGAAMPWNIGVVLALGVGLAMRANTLNVHRLELAREELARRAVAEERRRIAREVHDVVAHTLSVTMLHLAAAQLAVDRAPEQVRSALEEARRQGGAGLADVRRMVHLLRGDDEEGGTTLHGDPSPGSTGGDPVPTLDQLAELVEGYRAAGLSVALDVDGSAEVSPAVGGALYRVAQESLANAARHGRGGCAEVRVHLADEGATLLVRNPADPEAVRTVPVPAPGHGLVGMRERVTGLGGRLVAGPTGGSADWQVVAHLPRIPA